MAIILCQGGPRKIWCFCQSTKSSMPSKSGQLWLYSQKFLLLLITISSSLLDSTRGTGSYTSQPTRGVSPKQNLPTLMLHISSNYPYLQCISLFPSQVEFFPFKSDLEYISSFISTETLFFLKPIIILKHTSENEWFYRMRSKSVQNIGKEIFSNA